MREVLPGVFHWTTLHPRIRIDVSSYWLDRAGVAIDPLVPSEHGLEWFAERMSSPKAVLLSNRHHYRDSDRFVEAFGCSVHCNRAGLHEFSHGEAVEGFEPGDTLPGGVLACEVGGICPDETALYLPEQRAIALADGVVRGRRGSPPGFVPDSLMDDPPGPSAPCSLPTRASSTSSTSSTSSLRMAIPSSEMVARRCRNSSRPAGKPHSNSTAEPPRYSGMRAVSAHAHPPVRPCTIRA